MLWVLIRSAWKKCLICCCVPSVVLRSLLLPGSCQGLSSLRFWGLGLSTLFWALEELASPRKCNSQGSVDRSQHTVHRISDARSSGPCNPQLCVTWGGRGVILWFTLATCSGYGKYIECKIILLRRQIYPRIDFLQTLHVICTSTATTKIAFILDQRFVGLRRAPPCTPGLNVYLSQNSTIQYDSQ